MDSANSQNIRIPDRERLIAYSEGKLDMGDFEEQGFSIYEVREGMLRLKLPIPGLEITGSESPALKRLLEGQAQLASRP